nr:uncharacterized protein DKFZp434B061-like [Aegilops tauschii subsp. strangulata]
MDARLLSLPCLRATPSKAPAASPTPHAGPARRCAPGRLPHSASTPRLAASSRTRSPARWILRFGSHTHRVLLAAVFSNLADFSARRHQPAAGSPRRVAAPGSRPAASFTHTWPPGYRCPRLRLHPAPAPTLLPARAPPPRAGVRLAAAAFRAGSTYQLLRPSRPAATRSPSPARLPAPASFQAAPRTPALSRQPRPPRLCRVRFPPRPAPARSPAGARDPASAPSPSRGHASRRLAHPRLRRAGRLPRARAQLSSPRTPPPSAARPPLCCSALAYTAHADLPPRAPAPPATRSAGFHPLPGRLASARLPASRAPCRVVAPPAAFPRRAAGLQSPCRVAAPSAASVAPAGCTPPGRLRPGPRLRPAHYDALGPTPARLQRPSRALAPLAPLRPGSPGRKR